MKKKIQKPFDVEAAKNGAKMETRGGKPVRIVCYNRIGTDYSIVALVNYQVSESCSTYTTKGELFKGEADEEDLVIIEEIEVSKFNPGDWMFAKNGGGHSWLITAITPGYYAGAMENMAENPEQREKVSMEALLKNMYDIL